jgi:uncharacterized membrane protein
MRDYPQYPTTHVALQHFFMPALILVAIGWLYVALMMAVAEATAPAGTILGAFLTFVLYGVGPVALLMYLMSHPARRAARRRREAQASAAPEAGGEAPADAVAPVREET